jgi:uncharacterized protein (TIGR00369 family)
MPIMAACAKPVAKPKPAGGSGPLDQSASREPRITAAAFRALAFDGVPYAGQLGCRLERFEAGRVTLRMPYQKLLRRPGGTICGPALMALADVTLYGVVLSVVGEAALAVTTDMTIHFLSRPAPRDVLASGGLLKLGRRLAVGEVTMHSDGDARAICHVVGTYAIPPEAGREEIEAQVGPDTALTAGHLRPR